MGLLNRIFRKKPDNVKKVTSVYINVDLWNKLKLISIKENKSISDILNTLIYDFLKEKGEV